MMDLVVVLSWDPQRRELRFVPVNGGAGGAEQTINIVTPDDVLAITKECDDGGLPRVGQLCAEDSMCLLELSGPAATRCSVKPKKSIIHLRDPERDAQVAEVSPDSLGLPDADSVQLAYKIGFFWLFSERLSEGEIGCWETAGGLSGWLDRRREERAANRRRKEEHQTREQARKAAEQAAEAADRRFINPYTFVPFPSAIVREEPGCHAALGRGRLSGTFTVRWTMTSPMQAPPGSADGQRLRVPGASVKGAVRAMHETLAGGCLRVFDQDFVPSYRDLAAVPAAEWTLAVVDSVTRDGQPLRVQVCDQVVWVGAAQLRAACGGDLRSGSRVNFDPPREKTSLGRYELPEDAEVRRGGDWIVLLTDAGARPKRKRNKQPGSYFAACGHLAPDVGCTDVSEAAWREFRQAAAGAREVQQARTSGGSTAKQPVPVEFPEEGQLIGYREAATDRFAKHDLLWVRRPAGHGKVDGLRLSCIWRHVGWGPLGSRVPTHLHGCTDPEDLCISCRLFGMADTRVRDQDGKAEQRAYAGHVRFGDAQSAEPVTLKPIRRAPMGTPSPGAGQFYLRLEDTKSAAAEGDRPTREWGAKPDRMATKDAVPARQVRGRKYYWHADPTQQAVPRYEARPHQTNEKMKTDALLADPGTVLLQTVTFDNLTAAEVGSLLAALQPETAILPDQSGSRSLRLHLGGGKPLGLGSCHARIEDLRVWTAESRYGPADPIEPAIERYVTDFVATVPTEVRETWPALTAVLADDTVNPEQVWYPPGEHWSAQQREHWTDRKHIDGRLAKRFDEPFAFFTGTSGMPLKQAKPRPLCPLPDPTDEDQTLPIIRGCELGKCSDKECDQR